MQVLFEDVDIRDRGTNEIRQTIDIRVTPEEARRKVNRWVLDSVSYMMHAETPTMVIDECAVWRVPVVLTASHAGRVGVVGEIDVDASTRRIDADVDRIASMYARAMEFVKDYPPYEPLRNVPESYRLEQKSAMLVAESPEGYGADSEDR